MATAILPRSTSTFSQKTLDSVNSRPKPLNMKTMGIIGRSVLRMAQFRAILFVLAGLLGSIALTDPLSVNGKPGSGGGGGSTSSVTFSGQAYVVKASVPDL